MAAPAKKPRPTPSTATYPEIPRALVTVEIETWARGGTPKVSVRVDDDDPETARQLAFDTYLKTVRALEQEFPPKEEGGGSRQVSE